ncbi:MAG: LamG-like jellyroll fold domain-containing protein [Owenweeksia sp.]
MILNYPLTRNFLFAFTTLWVLNPFFSHAQFSGGAGTIGDPWQITTLADLQAIDNVTYLADYFILMNDIDASATSGWNSGAGFDPIGDFTNRFSGSVNGNGYKISNLNINRSSTDYIGLFGYADDASVPCTIENLGLVNVSITGNYYVGGLIGRTSYVAVTNCYVTGSVSGSGTEIGGLIGYQYEETISRCFTDVSVNGGGNYTGGVIGYLEGGELYNSYALGSVHSTNGDAGGLVGEIEDYEIQYCYATGVVSGGSPSSDPGGLISYVDGGDVDDSYWNTDSTATSDEGTGLTTAQMKSSANYTGFDFNTIWAINPNINNGYPYLRDNAPIEANAQNAVIYLDASGNAILTTNNVDDGSKAISGIASLSLSQTAFSCSNADTIPSIVTVLDLDGTNDFIRVPNNAAYESNLGTLEMWVKPNSFSGNRCLIAMRLDGTGVRYSYFLNQQANQIAIWNGGTYSSITYDQGFNADTWYHIALTYTSSRTDVYVNGQYVNSLTAGASTATTGRDLTIGASSINGAEAFPGQISDVRIWNYWRNAVEINTNRSRLLTGSESGLVGFFPVLKGKGDTVYDHSSTDNDGLLTNMDASTDWINTGTQVVLTVLDNDGNTTADTAYVTIADNTIPTVIAQNINKFAYANGSVTVTTGDLNNNSSDNCTLTLAVNKSNVSFADTVLPLSRTLHFDASNDFVVIPNDADFEFTTGTIEIWVKPNAGNSSGILGMRYGGSTRYSFHLDEPSDLIGLWNGGSYNTIPYPFIGGEWYHIALSIQPNKVDVFINGQSVGSFYAGINSAATGSVLKPLVVRLMRSVTGMTSAPRTKYKPICTWPWPGTKPTSWPIILSMKLPTPLLRTMALTAITERWPIWTPPPTGLTIIHP